MRHIVGWILLICLSGLALSALIEPKGELDTTGHGQVKIDQPFRVFGTDYPAGTILYMNLPFGRISIGKEFMDNLPLDKGVVPNVNLIQPVELSIQSNLDKAQKAYMASITGELLNNMSLLVRENFWLESNFTARSGQLLTWEDQKGTASPSLVNTFQVAFIFGTSSTYVLFNYHLVQFVKHLSINAEAMFTRGNSHDQLSLPFSGADVGRLASTSGLADRSLGRFIYRVDSWPPKRGGCLSDDPTKQGDRTLSASLYSDSVLGGSSAILSGRCPDDSSASGAVCRITTSGGSLLAQRPAVRCDRCGAAFMACEVPPSLTAGPAVLELRMADSVYSHQFSFASPDDSSVLKVHLNDSMDNWMQLEPTSLSITYDADGTQNGSLKLQVVGYSEAGLSRLDRDEDFKSLTKVLYEGPASSSGRMNLGDKTVRCAAGNADCENYQVGFLRIQDSATPPTTLKSRIIPLGWFVHPYYLDKSQPAWPAAKCKAWQEAQSGAEEQKVAAVLRTLACPGSLNQALANPGQFMPATYCPSLPGGCGSATPSQQCLVSKPGIDRQLQGVPAAVCCYSQADGNLIYQEQQDPSQQKSGQWMGSGSLRSHPNGQLTTRGGDQPLLPGQASYLSNWYWDALPRLHCCRWSADTGDCQLRFIPARPTPRTSMYSPAQPSHQVGDPHLTSFNGRRFLFNGLGEFWLLRAEPGVAMQTRYQLASFITPSATFLTALAGRPLPGTGDMVEVSAVSGSPARFQVQYRREGWEPSQTITADLKVGGAPLLIGDGIAVLLNSTDRLSLQLSSGADSLGVELKLVTVGNFSYMDMFLTLSPSLKARTRGLLGQWTDDPTKEFIDISGNVVPFNSNSEQFHADFCNKNRLANVNSSYFGYSGSGTRGEGFLEMNPDLAFYKPLYNDSGLGADSQEDAVCGSSTSCRFDFRVTKNRQVAAATAANEKMFDELLAASEGNVSVCDVPALPGLRIDQPLTAGSSLVLACAQPLLSSRSGLTIVCARQASGNVTWQPDPASLGFQCLLPTAQVNTANIGLIIGIVVPCVILLLVGIVVVIIIVRRRSEKQPVQSSKKENRSFLEGTHSAGQPGAPPRQYSQDEGNRRNPHGVPPPHSAAAPLAYSPAGYGVVSGVDSDDNGGQFVPIMMPPQHQPRATMTPSPQPVPAQRRSFERSQQNQVMQGPDERATFPHQQQPPPPQQKPRSSKPKPTMSHSEVV
ncbi:hypothetical protein BOX15_Mlig017972g3 [Macrostomum lignano]|uniref:AMOP domain-containing protein n=1 Tax=Macrostomum lignano TaxID=282301 RepID=A0A267FLP3_9PLAT|nr:hypothetical protein BOX15_Mlig017972g3 [Macrostomum lignano]